MSAAVLRSGDGREAGRGAEQKPPLSGRGEKPVSDDSRRWNGVEWKRGPVERFTGGAEMERSRDGLNWRFEAGSTADSH